MAKSPAHRLGELLGDFFEESIIEYLKPRVEEKGYYLDYNISDLQEIMGGK